MFHGGRCEKHWSRVAMMPSSSLPPETAPSLVCYKHREKSKGRIAAIRLMTEGKGILRRTKSGEDEREKRIPSSEWSTETQRTSYYVTKYQEKRKLQERINSIPPDFYQRNEVFLFSSEKLNTNPSETVPATST